MNSSLIINNCSLIEGDVILTIAIPTYKRFSLLKETLRSVFDLKFNIPIEVIIVDNDPENVDLAIKEMQEFLGYKFKYYKNESNYGAAGNWNRCLELAIGQFITLLHDDDLLCENFPYEIESYFNSLEKLECAPMIGFDAHVLEQRDACSKVKVGFIYTLVKNIYQKYKNMRTMNDYQFKDLQSFIFSGSYVSTLGVVMDRKKALAISGFDNSWYPVIDCEFYIRWIRAYGDVIYKNVKVSKYRILQNDSMKQEVIRDVIKKSYELRMKVHNEEHNLVGIDKFAKIMKKIEDYTWNMKWRKGNEYKINILDVAKLLLLKLNCILHIRKINLMRK
ncbi:glycosyltransferase family 2 protein [Yersinia pseudotuberculosis]|uniref:glycosyltransferase family 2 protein n=1 Tax=Yersinia pseudotuberculosis TaxID=633 RepID=UPI001A9D4A9A|nr:glycosyltransferase family 2 protein [Yersinia pseudotuberculosis]MBO1550551.1 glycosyltransferase [Yersinia pseudotuberculosis]MBO1570567.1 glycosyltransferase [Yersinia pseudotuberculosis]MBO1585674.1 glycosyltransferase [Yersinia pseudotuberculosis]MBO1634997.1 glycosyltransferase [Yersinia pseudotuberculosis]